MTGCRIDGTPTPWLHKLRQALSLRQGVRFGEAAVVSRQVHVSDPAKPEAITILTSADAGEVFYGRSRQGEIIHVDIFHGVADVDHHRIAEALGRCLRGAHADGIRVLDYFDVVTGTGGGRVTGDLSYGRKPSLRAAHRNHVHLAGLLPDGQLHLLQSIVDAVEAELEAQGVQLRRLDRIKHTRWSKGQPLDLSPYTDSSDSWLQGRRGGQADGQSLRTGGVRTGGGSAGSSSSTGSSSPRHGASQGGSGAESHQPPATMDPFQEAERLREALDLSRRLGSPEEAKRVLDDLSQEQGWASIYSTGSSQAPFTVRQLEEKGLVRRDIRGLRLTEAGKELATYLNRHLRDVKIRFRKLIRRVPANATRAARKPGFTMGPPSADVRYGLVRGTAPAKPGAWLGDVAVPETIRSALIRTRLEQLQTRESKLPGLRLQRKDVHVYLRSGDHPLNICLLIDASASMAGRRILAAKHLARHLLVSTRDRIAVIAFQERDVRVYVPFTRDHSQLEAGLAQIQPMGLTPLAHGLTRSLELIRKSRVRRPLLLLITDGIPTVPLCSMDPLSDALGSAREVGKARIPFGCIGLQPSRRYLEDLARVADGTLHVVDELDEEALMTIAHQERFKTVRRHQESS